MKADPNATAEARHALKVRAVDEALRAALKQQAALVAKVGRARAKLTAKEDEVEGVKAELRAHLDARVAAVRARDRAIHALFVALVNDKRRRVRVRERLDAVHEALSDDIVLSADGYAEAWARFRGASDARTGPSPLDELGLDDDDEVVGSAPRGDQSLRGLFRRLAETLHPDKVQDPDIKAARTEVMKQVTVAYREGDLARLLELERTWMTRVEVATLDQQARRLTLVEQAITALEAELRELERARRTMRRSPGRDLLRAVGPVEGRAERMAAMIAGMGRDLDAELAQLDAFHAHVVAYRDRTTASDGRFGGPHSQHHDLDELLAEVDALARTAPRGKRPRRGAARRCYSRST